MKNMTIQGRTLGREEIKDVWTIDRREVIESIYYHEGGGLVLKAEHYNMSGWPPGEPGIYTPLFEECYDQGGWFYALFDGEIMVGVVVLENRIIGRDRDQLQLKFLMVSRDYRAQGLGRKLFHLASKEAQRRGARRLYISATPSRNTINFYLNLGCTVTDEVDPDLYKLEPEDIHLEYRIDLSEKD